MLSAVSRVSRVSLVMLVLAAGLASGCADLMRGLKDVTSQRPGARVTGVRLADLGLQSLTLEFDIAVDNPYSFDLPLIDFDFALATRSTPFLNGNTQVDGSVPAGGSRTLDMPVRVDLRGLLETVSSLRPGQVVPYDAELGLSVDVPGTGPLRLPLRKSGEMPVPSPPKIEVAGLEWSEVSLNRVGGVLSLDVGNTGEFPFSLRGLRYDLSLADTRVAEGSSEQGLDLPAGETGRLALPLSFSPRDVGAAILNAIAGSSTEYAIGGNVTLDSPFGSMDLPFAQAGVAPLGR